MSLYLHSIRFRSEQLEASKQIPRYKMPYTEDVEVKDSDIAGAGRGLFAKKDFKPGEIIIALNRPMVAELDVAHMADTCAWCFHREETDFLRKTNDAMMGNPTATTSVKACTGCKKVKYCSKQCQTKAWRREHKYECKALAPTERPDLPHGVRAVIKLLGRLAADPAGKDEPLLDTLQFMPAVNPSKLEEIRKKNPQRFEDFNMLSYGAWKYAGEPMLGDMGSRDIAHALFFNVISNTMNLSSSLDEVSLGIGFDPLICSANHSCDPNAVSCFTQPRILLRALKRIKKGEEIFNKYIDLSNPMSVRHAELKEMYFFDCRCSKCSKGYIFQEDLFAKPADQLPESWRSKAAALLEKHEAQPADFAKFYVGDSIPERHLAALQAEAFAVSGTRVEHDTSTSRSNLGEIKDAIKMCVESGMWPIHRQPLPHLMHQMFATYLAIDDKYRAFRVGAKLLVEVQPKLMPQRFCPDRVIFTWAMQTVTNQLCAPSQQDVYQEFLEAGLDLRWVFFGLILEVHDQMQYADGRDSPFGRVSEKIYQQIIAGMPIKETEIRQKVSEAWPKFEMFAKQMNVLSL